MRKILVGLFSVSLTMGLTVGVAEAATDPAPSVVAPVPLSQVRDLPDRAANARVTDPDGKVIGSVQKVDLQDGRPRRLDVALLGSENTVTLDASTVRYDMNSNVVSAGQTADQLAARPKN
ncbi:MAG: hypothetical protein JO256_03105 [Alphaproteobacteria bacterium]|nr:hypothetical protein [Alphaproteobacteria bacterium]